MYHIPNMQGFVHWINAMVENTPVKLPFVKIKKPRSEFSDLSKAVQI